MPELCSKALSQNGRSSGLAVHFRDRGEEFATQADLKLARYPADVRDQVTELLRVLSAKPGEVEKGGR
jgi:hypothetical protein